MPTGSGTAMAAAVGRARSAARNPAGNSASQCQSLAPTIWSTSSSVPKSRGCSWQMWLPR